MTTSTKRAAKTRAWTCPRCGPVDDVLHGADELLHCLECDAIVEGLSPEELRPQVNPWRTPFKPASVVDRDLKPGNVPGAHAARASDRATEKIVAKEDDPRWGRCETCGQDKWLLRKNPATCSKCHRQAFPSKRPARGPSTSPREAFASPRAVEGPREDEGQERLGRECRATEGVSRALHGLSRESAFRVLRAAFALLELDGPQDDAPRALLPGPRAR